MNDIRDKVNKLDDEVIFVPQSPHHELDIHFSAAELKAAMGAADTAVRYALATFRALDRYTFEDSDHGLLIAEAVEKLESAATLAPPAREWVAIGTEDDLPKEDGSYWWTARQTGRVDSVFYYADSKPEYVRIYSAYMPKETKPQPFVPKEPKL